MMTSIGSAERAVIVGSTVNGILGATLGALVAGLAGAQLGLVGGIVLAVLPLVARTAWRWLSRPAGLPRFVVAQTGAAAVDLGRAITHGVASVIGPVVGLLRGPILLTRLAADAILAGLAGLPGRLGRLLFTPLGMANLAALGVIAINVADLDFATPVAFLAFGMMLLVLLVSESEARDAEAAGKLGSER